MSMWKTIPTLFGDLADRPDAADVPYGTQFFAEDTEELFGSDESVWHPLAVGGGGVDVEDDGTPVASGVDTLNFGDNLTVTDDGGGQVTIDAEGDAIRGQAVIDDPGTDVTVPVEFPSTPEPGEVQVTPVDDTDGWLDGASSAKFAVSDFTAVSFRIAVDAAPGSGKHATFDWLWVAGQPQGWTPAELSGLVGWWRADAITGLSNSDPVASWPDSSANNTPLTQGTAAHQPTYLTAGPNGLPYVNFDGSNDHIARARLYSDDIFTMLVVVRGAAQSNRSICCQHRGLADVGRTQFLNTGQTNTNRGRVFFNNGSSFGAETSTVVFDDTWQILQCASDGAGNTAMRVGGGGDEATITGQTWTPFNTLFGVGAIGAGTGNQGSHFGGGIAELICYDVHHSDSDRDDAVDYLADKYDITL